MSFYCGLVAFLLFFYCRCSYAFDERNHVDVCQNTVNLFVSYPNKKLLDFLLTGKYNCWPFVGSSNIYLNKLNERVSEGNSFGARYLAANIKNLDGGNLEDSLIALGGFSDHKMEQLLVFAHEGVLSRHNLVDSLTMLPLRFSDDPRRQLEILKKRRGEIEKVRRNDLVSEKMLALKSIDDFMREIKSDNAGL
jgi:hypothetical protein